MRSTVQAVGSRYRSLPAGVQASISIDPFHSRHSDLLGANPCVVDRFNNGSILSSVLVSHIREWACTIPEPWNQLSYMKCCHYGCCEFHVCFSCFSKSKRLPLRRFAILVVFSMLVLSALFCIFHLCPCSTTPDLNRRHQAGYLKPAGQGTQKSWSALEDAGLTPTLHCAVWCKADKIKHDYYL